MGSRTKSALVAKMEAADKRERQIERRQPRDDGFLRRANNWPLTAAEDNAASRKRKVYIPAWQRWQHEQFVRKVMAKRGDTAALAAREALLPLDWYRPGAEGYRGEMQMPDKAEG